MAFYPLPLRCFQFLAALAVTFGFLNERAFAQAKPPTNYGEIAQRVVRMLEEEHYLRQVFDDSMSERVLKNYLEFLDFSRVYFTQADVDKFREDYLHTIDDSVVQKDIPAAAEIYAIYEERVKSRVEFAKKLLKEEKFTFDSDRVIHLSRKEMEWPANGEESDQLWRNLIEGDLLQEHLRRAASERAKKERAAKGLPEIDGDPKKEEETPQETIAKRYERILQSVNENTTEDVAVMFVKSISRAYDPHSEYFSQSQYDNFKIGMNKKLTGIGAMLQLEEDGSASIQGLVVGGPAFKNGELQVGDKVIGVAQGDEGEMVDVIPLKLNKIVDLIRGDKGSTVRLKVTPADSPDPSATKEIQIVRDLVDLKDSLATADLIETKDPNGNPQKLGWINLPSFYSDMDGGKTSTTVDVQRLLTRLMAEGMDGLVVDLRDNGGGSLEEAVNMTGLFIPRGPVVQSQDWRGQRNYKTSRNRDAVYKGPLIVLTNRASASASEIFAAALQDYNRAVIVGEKASFGKGTVQQLRPVFTRNNFMIPLGRGDANQNGALKLTIQTFFRINGTSTQLDGVVPDVRLPSTNDVLDIGEAALPNALKADPIDPAIYEPVSRKALPSEVLQVGVDARIATDQEFQYILEDIKFSQDRKKKNTISLNRAQREAEAAKFEQQRNDRKKERIDRFAKIRDEEKDLFTLFTFTQDNVYEKEKTLKSDLSLEELSGMTTGKEKEKDPEQEALKYPHTFDPFERETVHILQDLIAIQQTGKPVHISKVAERKTEEVPRKEAN
ncbi:MAG: carboxy terminal-processing peptidase [Verrucomicrobiales bacterium]|nr:carboxy terminal-processing peptidase [Verrucomicrobiales bacterium]